MEWNDWLDLVLRAAVIRAVCVWLVSLIPLHWFIHKSFHLFHKFHWFVHSSISSHQLFNQPSLSCSNNCTVIIFLFHFHSNNFTSLNWMNENKIKKKVIFLFCFGWMNERVKLNCGLPPPSKSFTLCIAGLFGYSWMAQPNTPLSLFIQPFIQFFLYSINLFRNARLFFNY